MPLAKIAEVVNVLKRRMTLLVFQTKVKKLVPEAVIPARAKEGDAGYDLVAIDDGVVGKDGFIEYRTGLAISPPGGIHILIFPRSSISKYDLVLANGIGLVDNGYRGEILLRFKPVSRFINDNGGIDSVLPSKRYVKGDKIGQLVFMPTLTVNMSESETLDETQRGSGGFGSSGN